MNLEKIPQYISLYVDKADKEVNKYTWKIPDNYYGGSNRGPVCYVSLVNCNIFADYEGGITIEYNNGGQNIISTNNSGNAYLGNIQLILGGSRNNFHTFNNVENVKILTQSKPNYITISTYDINGNSQPINEGVFILKFEYLNEEQTNKEYTETYYNKL